MPLELLLSTPNLQDPMWWLELWIHIVFICSAASYVLAPFEEWAKDNCSPETFKKIHSGISLIQKYGALNKRSNLGGVDLSQFQQKPPADGAK